ncbi:Scavenger receptor cysteine-rich domain superfamily protein [Geodia barretti]|uniref:Scavenger receptor cysteine-rich domain superfamily protein n=1 Tax=Geodia barretti TaxID=519541 RepID=A0AA35X6Q7_GEOBA|nr:Scavenger receptor cysteine-rich domain superfamily protein [Geodia barretti]
MPCVWDLMAGILAHASLATVEMVPIVMILMNVSWSWTTAQKMLFALMPLAVTHVHAKKDTLAMGLHVIGDAQSQSCEKKPCENATCPGQVEAECVVDLDNCSATWFIDCKDVTHLCQVCNDGDVRLINITNDTNEMLVEICYDSTWGLVCDDQWGANDNNAQVVCKQYCFESGEKGKMCPNLNDGIFWLDEVNCTGDEGRLDNCTHNNIGEHDCTLAEAVTVICSSKPFPLFVCRDTE